MIELGEHQKKAIEKLKNGSILCGATGSGKSRAAVAYYFLKECLGEVPINGEGFWGAMKAPRDLYIITTAKKRDSNEWLEECAPFCITSNKESNISGVDLNIDSWNNIKKYTDVSDAFFIFDEQRVVGYGAWVKAFLKITKKNHWILLSATPGDTWTDYIPVFIANGFYKNKREFVEQHVVYAPYSKFPKVSRYFSTGRLIRHRNDILVNMPYKKEAHKNYISVSAEYNKYLYSRVWKDRWNVYDEKPIRETGKLYYLMRKVINSDESRIERVKEIISDHPKAIIFYNFTYELELLKAELGCIGIPYSEWNGKKHEDILNGEQWVYLVQYSAGCEGWNCITTDTIIFYSQSYSYRMTAQAEGRIDRLNTPYKELYYYKIKSFAPLDIAIARALNAKKDFNERAFLKDSGN